MRVVVAAPPSQTFSEFPKKAQHLSSSPHWISNRVNVIDRQVTQLSLLGSFRWSLAPCLRRSDSCPLILALYITYTCCSAVDNITGSSASREQRGECFGKYVCPGGNLHLCNTALANYLPQAELAKPGPCYEERRGEQGEQINVVLVVVVVVGPSFLPSSLFAPLIVTWVTTATTVVSLFHVA